MNQIGKFIVLEGVDGSGISTQVALLQNWLDEKQEQFGKTHFTKEPTDGPVGSLLRQALSKRLKPLDERVMALLFAADRLDHLTCTSDNEQKPGINEMLSQGINVISDRYYLSSFAYQSLKMDLSWVQEINKFARKPDLFIFLLVPVQESAKRRDKTRFHEELYEAQNYLEKIRTNYLAIVEKLRESGENILIINGARPKEEVFADIQSAILNTLT